MGGIMISSLNNCTAMCGTLSIAKMAENISNAPAHQEVENAQRQSDTVTISAQGKALANELNNALISTESSGDVSKTPPDDLIYFETGKTAGSFSGDKISETILQDLGGFISDKIGNKEIGEKLVSRLSKSGHFMTEISKVVTEIYKENGAEAAQRLVDFMNGDLKNAINSNDAIINASEHGTVLFEGWELVQPESETAEMLSKSNYKKGGLIEYWQVVGGTSRNVQHLFRDGSNIENGFLKSK